MLCIGGMEFPAHTLSSHLQSHLFPVPALASCQLLFLMWEAPPFLVGSLYLLCVSVMLFPFYAPHS